MSVSGSIRLGPVAVPITAEVERFARLALVALSLSLVGAIGALAYWSAAQFDERADSVEHTKRVRLEIEALQARYSRTRFHWRSYLITGDAAAHAAFEDAAKALPRQVSGLRDLLQDNPDQQQRLARIGALLESDLRAMSETAARKRLGALDHAEAILAEFATGRRAVFDIGAIAEAMQQAEIGLLAARRSQAQAASARVRWAIAGAGATSLLLLAGAFWFNFRELARRREAERKARSAAAEAEDLFENAPCGYHSVDAEGRIVRMNRTWLDWLGYAREEVVGRKFHYELMTPASAAQFREKWFPLFRRQGWLKEVEFEYRRKDGSTFPGSLQTTAVLDAAGNYVTSRTVVVDVSARKAADDRIRQLNSDLRQKAAQLEAVNRELESFSYSVSHDLRAPLRAVDGYAQMLEEDYAAALDDEGRRLLGVVRGEAARMGQLIDDLLEFSRTGRQALQVDAVDMAALAREAAAQVGAGFPGATVEIASLPQAKGDRAMLKQVWLNLIGNALKYSARQPQPRVEVGGRAEGEEAEYWVRDNGAGFDPRYAGKLFGVFQRLHGAEEFPGTGVGLAIVQRVVARHGGRVRAEGAVDGGACFTFTLPAAEAHG